MIVQQKHPTVHVLFRISVIGKGLDGVLEILGGVALLLVRPDQIGRLVRALTQHELSEDPHDMVVSFLRQSAAHLSTGTQVFASLFLLWHGAVKVGLVVGLLRKQLWAYPTAIAAFGLFITYQLYRYWHTRSVWLLLLSLLDLVVIVLSWLEYRGLLASRERHGAGPV